MDWLTQMVREIKQSRGFGAIGTRKPGRAGIDYSIEQLTQEGYRRNSIASACIQMIATSAPEAPLKVYKVADKNLIEDKNHWLSTLLKNPNPYLSTFELWEWVHTYMNTSGTNYWELVRETNDPEAPIIEIYPLRPDRMTIIQDAKEYIGGYVYKVNGEEIFYDPHEILTFKFPDPLNEYYGLAPLSRVARELDIDNEATDFTQAFLENDAVPGGILSTKEILNEVEADREAKRFWKKFRRGNRGKPAVLGKGTTYQQLAMNFKDMEFESIRSFTETRICSAFGVDPVLLPSWVGIRHGGRYSNYKEARIHLWEETIIPTLRRIESKMTTLLEDGYVAKFDLSVVAALAENENEVHTRAINAYNQGLLMLNESRVMAGYEPVKNGDQFKFLPGQKESGNKPPPDNGQLNNQDDRSRSNRTRRDNDKPGRNSGSNSDNSNSNKKDEEPEAKGVKITDDSITNFFNRLEQLEDRRVKLMKDDLQKMFLKHKGEMVKLIPSGESFNGVSLKEVERQLRAKDSWKTDLQQFADKHLFVIAFAASEIALNTLMVDDGKLFAPETKEEDQPEGVVPLFDGREPAIEEFLKEYVPSFVEHLNETTIDELMKILIEAANEGWAITKLKDMLRHKFNDWSDTRAEAVSRSEMIRAANSGVKEAYRAAGVTELEWHTHHDERTCPICKHMDGHKIGINEVFLKLGDTIQYEDNGKTKERKVTYEDVAVPPAHPNCRCTILPVVETIQPVPFE